MTDPSHLPFSGTSVRLRDVTLADADLIDDWNARLERGSFNDFGSRERLPREPLRQRRPLRNGHNGMLLIERIQDGRLEKAGYVREGTLRGAQYRAGAYHDLVYYSRLRRDP
jgi:hypothetical protein